MRLSSPATRLFVPKLIQANNKNQGSWLPILCVGNPPVIDNYSWIVIPGHDVATSSREPPSILTRGEDEQSSLNTLRSRQNGRHFPDDIFGHVFSSMKMHEFRLRFYWSLLPRVKLNDIPALVQMMALCRSGDQGWGEYTTQVLVLPKLINMNTLKHCTRVVLEYWFSSTRTRMFSTRPTPAGDKP